MNAGAGCFSDRKEKPVRSMPVLYKSTDIPHVPNVKNFPVPYGEQLEILSFQTKNLNKQSGREREIFRE